MEKVVHIYRTAEEADEADRQYYASLSPEQRVAIMLELLDYRTLFNNGAPDRLERVLTVSKLELR
ncbi:MAG: hypothetical protein NTV70_26055 [Acidobacteria bacterium]|nr:hypothetical protein [Acidobacteriota bacterium]